MGNATHLIRALAVLFVAVACAHAADRDDATPDRVRRMYDAGQVAPADALLDDYLAAHPTAPDACALRLLAATVPRPVFDAQQRLRDTAVACDDAPEGPAARRELAGLLHLAGRDRAALAVVDEFLERYPDDPAAPDLLLVRGTIELCLPAGATPGDSFRRFLAKYPGHAATAAALAGLADVKIRQGDWAGAEDAYLRALRENTAALDLSRVYYYLGFAAEKQGKKDMARHYYRLVVASWPETLVAWQAADRLQSTLAVGAPVLDTPPRAAGDTYSVSVGVYESLGEAEAAARRFSEAGMRVRLHLRQKKCELLVGEFDSRPAAKLFAEELARRFGVQAEPTLLP